MLYLPHTFSLYFKRDNFVPSHETKYRCKRKKETEQLCFRQVKPGADISFILKIIYHVMQTKMYLQEFF